MHWNGSTWTVTMLPDDLLTAGVVVRRLAVRSADSVLALGTDNHMLQWDGQSWHKFTAAVAAGVIINDIAYATDGRLWAVGGQSARAPVGQPGGQVPVIYSSF
jgi:hypothetical protein